MQFWKIFLYVKTAVPTFGQSLDKSLLFIPPSVRTVLDLKTLRLYVMYKQNLGSFMAHSDLRKMQ